MRLNSYNGNLIKQESMGFDPVFNEWRMQSSIYDCGGAIKVVPKKEKFSEFYRSTICTAHTNGVIAKLGNVSREIPPMEFCMALKVVYHYALTVFDRPKEEGMTELERLAMGGVFRIANFNRKRIRYRSPVMMYWAQWRWIRQLATIIKERNNGVETGDDIVCSTGE